jgi:hypothetical protein
MRFVYPKWIPGEHAPSGPIAQMMGLRVTANAQTLTWRRDPVDMFAFDVDVPKGATSIEVDFDYISPPIGYASGYGETPNHTQHLLDLPWNHVVVYPAGRAPTRSRSTPRWHFRRDGRATRSCRPDRCRSRRSSIRR